MDGIGTGVQRFALRCEACFNISLATAKAFCSRCGNGGTMKKVTMQVGFESFEWASRVDGRPSLID
jgi:RNA-binding protein NOB1